PPHPPSLHDALPILTARVATLLARLDRAADRAALQRALAFLRRTQESTGCWFGRWGTNYIYGTWSALTALTSVNRERDAVAIQRDRKSTRLNSSHVS